MSDGCSRSPNRNGEDLDPDPAETEQEMQNGVSTTANEGMPQKPDSLATLSSEKALQLLTRRPKITFPIRKPTQFHALELLESPKWRT